MVDNRILIIQENFRERVEMTEALENEGFKVDSVQNGTAVEALISRYRFALVVADLDTPEFSALDFLERLKEIDPQMELIILSERPLVEEAVTLMRHGALDFIVKPVVMEQIILTAKHQWAKQSQKETQAKDEAQPGQSFNEEAGSAAQRRVKIITRDRAMQRLLTLGKRVADSTAAVLIQGESGTGKELFARYIHENSPRINNAFVALNCAALPENLLESELFGHEKGAFTGAISKKEGKFELANKGTLFLDEITEMQFHLQAKLLRVLQEKVVDRLGGTEPVPVDVRIVASTNRDVKQSIKEGAFREDLYFRLNTIPLLVPPLRKRAGDLELLCNYFIEKYREIDGRDVKGMTPETFELLRRQKFSGNVRELENIIHRAVLLAQDELIVPEDLMMEDFEPTEPVEPSDEMPAAYHPPAPPSSISQGHSYKNGIASSHEKDGALQEGGESTGGGISHASDPAVNGDALLSSSSQSGHPHTSDVSSNQGMSYEPGSTSLKEMEEKMIFHTLDKTEGNRTHAAKILGISVRTLRNKLNEYKERAS